MFHRPLVLCVIVLQGWMKKLQGTEIQRREGDAPTPAIKNQRQQLKVECKMTTFSPFKAQAHTSIRTASVAVA